MENKSIYELGKMAKAGDDLAMLEIINIKKSILKKYSFGDEDRYQFLVMKVIEAVKRYKF